MNPVVAIGEVYHDTVHHINWVVVGIDSSKDLVMLEGGGHPSAISMTDLKNNLQHSVFVACHTKHFNCRCVIPAPALTYYKYPLSVYWPYDGFPIQQKPVCECGAVKARTTHADWCPLH